MNQLLTMFKENKFFRTAVIFGVLFLILVLTLSPKKNSSPSTIPSPAPHTNNTSSLPELINYKEEQLKQAEDYRNLIADRLPIFIENFHTSVGIDTTIHIFFMPQDPTSVVRFEITGISYVNKNSTPLSNPNIIAFQESYKKGLEELASRSMDPKQLIFIYGDVDYVVDTAKSWIEQYVKI